MPVNVEHMANGHKCRHDVGAHIENLTYISIFFREHADVIGAEAVTKQCAKIEELKRAMDKIETAATLERGEAAPCPTCNTQHFAGTCKA